MLCTHTAGLKVILQLFIMSEGLIQVRNYYTFGGVFITIYVCPLCKV